MLSEHSKLRQQSTNAIIMVLPDEFYSNPETLATNFAQQSGIGMTADKLAEINAEARREFDGLRAMLEDKGVRVTVYDGPKGSPDAIFPNNTFSTHEGDADRDIPSTAIIYPMLAENRQAEFSKERELELRDEFARVIDLRPERNKGRILEGTGSLVLDRINKIAYASLSERTDPELAQEWGEMAGYDVVTFDALHADGNPVYHTNVVMWMGTEAAGICLQAIPDAEQRGDVRKSLEDSGKQVFDLTFEQMDAPNFAGNALEVLNDRGEPVLVMSEAAWNAYTPEQQSQLNDIYSGNIIASPIPTIERNGGGSVRCMLAEKRSPKISPALKAVVTQARVEL